MTAIDHLIRMTLERHAWLAPAAEQVRRWRAEDAEQGIYWESTERNPRQAEQAAGLNNGD